MSTLSEQVIRTVALTDNLSMTLGEPVLPISAIVDALDEINVNSHTETSDCSLWAANFCGYVQEFTEELRALQEGKSDE